jgi:hypothetical protein
MRLDIAEILKTIFPIFQEMPLVAVSFDVHAGLYQLHGTRFHSGAPEAA